MDAVKFIEGRKRLCEAHDMCKDCPANRNIGCIFRLSVGDDPNEQVNLVEEWSAAHPRKTRQSVFLEQWPNARKDSGGTVLLCKRNFDVTLDCKHDVIGECDRCRREFWSQEVE